MFSFNSHVWNSKAIHCNIKITIKSARANIHGLEVDHVLGVLAGTSLAIPNNPYIDKSSLPSLQVPCDAQEAIRLALWFLRENNQT